MRTQVASPALKIWRRGKKGQDFFFSEGARPSKSHLFWPFCTGKSPFFLYFAQSWRGQIWSARPFLWEENAPCLGQIDNFLYWMLFVNLKRSFALLWFTHFQVLTKLHDADNDFTLVNSQHDKEIFLTENSESESYLMVNDALNIRPVPYGFQTHCCILSTSIRW